VIAAFQQSHNRGRDRAHPRSENQRGLDAFQLRDGFFRNRDRGIAIARVEVIGVRGPQLLVIVGDFKRRSLIDGSRQRPVFLVEVCSAAHRLGFGVMCLPFHKFLVSPE